MPRWALVLLVVVGVVCAGVGAGLLLTGSGGVAFGWAAYAPLPHRYASYLPVKLTWLQWRPRLGAALLALGAGTTGATSTALLLNRRRAASS